MDQYFFYKGPDDYNRPVFKHVSDSIFIGSCEHLVGDLKYDLTTPEKIVDYFNNNKETLVYFGRHFNKEPEGTSLKLDNINLFIK